MKFVRNTKQRAAILEAFEHSDRPLQVEEAHSYAREQVDSLSISTVYRALRALVDEGKVIPVIIPGEATRYELSGKGHHHHFFCRGCERTFELEGCVKGLRSLAPGGFSIEDHHITIFGRCKDCSS